MKKTLALVLALAMVFSTITVAFAEDTISADAKICADLGMLKGTTGTVDAGYTATAPTRIQAAVMFLRLKGLEAEATAFTGEANFADAKDAAWAKPIMAYLKANPQLGWLGDGTNFNPTGALTAQAYYKVLLESLGYKQSTAEVVGDFAYADTLTFAAGKGLTKVAAVTNYTVNDLAVATVEALKANVKEGGKTLAATLVEANKVDKAQAIAAGLYTEAAAAPAVAVDTVKAVGNSTIDVTYEDDVDATAANAALYTIEGLEVKSAVAADTDRITLETAAMTSGKIYTMTVGGKSVKFTGIAKVTGAPELKDAGVTGTDVEQVDVVFTKKIDVVTGSNVANYSLNNGVTVSKAVVDGDTVTLTTVGLKNKTKYTLKVANIKSVDGVSKKSDSQEFTTHYDVTAPKIASTEAEIPQTNDRIKIKFSEKVTKDSAENLANYSIKENTTDGDALEIKSVKWDSDDKNFVEITTESMVKNKEYKISIINIADRCNVANVMTRPATKTFKAKAVDTTAPAFVAADVLSPTTIMVTFTDASKLDEASVLDLNNYTLEDLNIESIAKVDSKLGQFRALLTVEEMETGKYYDLEAADILDEYGNAMKPKTLQAKAVKDNLAAVKVNSITATGENTIEVVFSAEVDEDSVENIANYSVDEGVGAPTDAVWEDDGAPVNSVTLTVNDLVDGYGEYDLVIDGVKDLAGNTLYYKKKVAFPAKAWDETAPEVQSFDILNKYVAAIAFDERVQYLDNTKLILNDGSKDIELLANDLTDDDTVIEFAYNGKVTFDPNKTYTVKDIVYSAPAKLAVSDLAGNFVDVNDGSIYDEAFTCEGSSEDADYAEVDSYEQTNGTNFDVTMTRNVMFKSGLTVKTDFDGTEYVTVKDKSVVPNDFNVSIDGDVVTFHKVTGKLTEDNDYKFDFTAFLTDMHGYAVVNADVVDKTEQTILTATDTDGDAPEVDTVTAKNRDVVKVLFDGDILRDGGYKATDFVLKNEDLDKTIDVTIYENDNDNEIQLWTAKPLEARYEYSLTIKKEAVKDMAGNKFASEETFYFNGSNLSNIAATPKY